MNERERIFGRIREALSVQTHASDRGTTSLKTSAEVLPLVGQTFEENAALFQKNALELRADFRLVEDMPGMTTALKSIAVAEKWGCVAWHAGELATPIADSLGLPLLKIDGRHDKHDLERCSAGLTECDALVAQTGSVLVTSRSAGGRALSVLPPHHIVLARREQLVPGLPDAFALLKSKYGANYPSMISFITGPSRTGDIERILVLGAHGPKKLTILCL